MFIAGAVTRTPNVDNTEKPWNIFHPVQFNHEDIGQATDATAPLFASDTREMAEACAAELNKVIDKYVALRDGSSEG
jgi:hypothetical protein